ncbi:hypothetical protein [Litoribacillus peritrichatus]|uniref:Uncharacterized protein n=1 Tax=Litoribacillus peritrichatus TaxID=718191 RepID=A0ABP7M749_9GAMM
MNIKTSPERTILDCIKTCSNPFDSSEANTLQRTLNAITVVLESTSKLDVVAVLENEELRLEKLLEEGAGSMVGYEMQLADKDALWNCRAAIKYVKEN